MNDASAVPPPPPPPPLPLPTEPAPLRDEPVGAIADGRWRPIDDRYVGAERVGGWIFAAIVLAPSIVFVALTLILGWFPLAARLGIAGGWLVLAAGLVWLVHVFPAIDHRHRAYRVGADGVEIRAGVIWRRVTSVPRSRVQHTDVERGPIMRRFGLAKLVVHTAGTESASVEIVGLADSVAERLRDFLVHETDDG